MQTTRFQGSADRRQAAAPLLQPTARLVAAAIVAVCVATTALLGVWFAHQTRADWLDAAIDARVQTGFRGHPQVLSVLAEPGQLRAVAAMTAALALACVVCRRYRGAALLVLSVPMAAVITELLLKPYIGRYFGSSLTFPSGHATGVFALATAVTVLLTAWPSSAPLRALRLLLSFIAFLVAAATAVAVIGLEFHYFTDTVGGAAVGIGTVLLTAIILDLLSSGLQRSRERRSLFPPHSREGAPVHED